MTWSEGVEYVSYVVVGNSTKHILWHWDTWRQIFPRIDPLVRACRGQAGVRSIQWLCESRSDIRFGKMGWDEKSHKKWTHESDLDRVKSSAWRFIIDLCMIKVTPRGVLGPVTGLPGPCHCYIGGAKINNMELWAPRWTVCEREGMAPDLYIQIENPFFLFASTMPGQFNQIFHIAACESQYARQKEVVREALLAIGSMIGGVLVVARRSVWNNNGDAVRDYLWNHFRYTNRDNDPVPDVSKLPKGWVVADLTGALPNKEDLPLSGNCWYTR